MACPISGAPSFSTSFITLSIPVAIRISSWVSLILSCSSSEIELGSPLNTSLVSFWDWEYNFLLALDNLVPALDNLLAMIRPEISGVSVLDSRLIFSNSISIVP